MSEWAHKIIESMVTNGNADRVVSPKIGSVVLYCGAPVKILSGHFYGSFGGVSNFWKWENLRTGEKESGYGEFYLLKA